MGCDIHLYVERRENGKWATCDQWETETYDGREYRDVNYEKSFYHHRNYDLFAILADVRNRYAFVPIAAPRGIPDDCCLEYRVAAEDVDGHTHSWLTVAEIMAYDWTQVTTKSGLVTPKGWAQWKLRGEPNCWHVASGAIDVSNEDMERAAKQVTEGNLWKLYHDGDHLPSGPISKAIHQKLGGLAVTKVAWQVRYYESGVQFLGTVLPRLWRLGKPDDVRIVFFFDN